MAEPRHFPPPWSVEETGQCFIVHDANEQALGLSSIAARQAAHVFPRCPGGFVEEKDATSRASGSERHKLRRQVLCEFQALLCR